MNELHHHGVLGQKWGVRRTPEQLGHHPSSAIKTKKNENKEKKKRNILTSQHVQNHHPSSAIKTKKNENNILTNKHIMSGLEFTQQMMIQQQNQRFMDWSMQESVRNSINAGNQAMSLGISGGTNPFIFGQM